MSNWDRGALMEVRKRYRKRRLQTAKETSPAFAIGALVYRKVGVFEN